ncbi:hypothetical protein LguiB_026536 [Lonicera macranthoides]
MANFIIKKWVKWSKITKVQQDMGLWRFVSFRGCLHWWSINIELWRIQIGSQVNNR